MPKLIYPRDQKDIIKKMVTIGSKYEVSQTQTLSPSSAAPIATPTSTQKHQKRKFVPHLFNKYVGSPKYLQEINKVDISLRNMEILSQQDSAKKSMQQSCNFNLTATSFNSQIFAQNTDDISNDIQNKARRSSFLSFTRNGNLDNAKTTQTLDGRIEIDLNKTSQTFSISRNNIPVKRILTASRYNSKLQRQSSNQRTSKQQQDTISSSPQVQYKKSEFKDFEEEQYQKMFRFSGQIQNHENRKNIYEILQQESVKLSKKYNISELKIKLKQLKRNAELSPRQNEISPSHSPVNKHEKSLISRNQQNRALSIQSKSRNIQNLIQQIGASQKSQESIEKTSNNAIQNYAKVPLVYQEYLDHDTKKRTYYASRDGDEQIKSNQSTTNNLQKYQLKFQNQNHNRNKSAIQINNNFVRKNYWITKQAQDSKLSSRNKVDLDQNQTQQPERFLKKLVIQSQSEYEHNRSSSRQQESITLDFDSSMMSETDKFFSRKSALNFL
ncbi:UNKNOWN [Stylonychia lemnae]|uniref:Uncharacterized protein n=1 Tax=Stylonychia lemnae TaxID=5949 RepID=A0A078B4R9_STYLE|nr:UNKNOWN [Stylonychia lemnae]|eukprot:CDW89419.1 UNKNOWN [Stylonychia lemnae]